MPLDIVERPEVDRIKAFELYLSANLAGKPRSHRQIAAELGVSSMTIGRWSKVDEWDNKVNKILSEAATGAETNANALKRRVRQGLLDGLTQLQYIATKGDKDSDKINAIKALADIAIKLDAISAASAASPTQKAAVVFNDDLPLETDRWQETSEKPSRLDETGVEIEASPLPPPESQEETQPPSSVEDSVLPPVEEAEAILDALDSESETQ